MKKKAASNVPTRPQSHTLSPVPAKSEAAVDRVIVSMNRKLRHLETKYQDLVSQCQDFRRSEQSESAGELREREALQELETERDQVETEVQLLLKTRKAKLGDMEESKDMRSARSIHEAISETLKTAQTDFLKLLHLATVSEYQAKLQATDMFIGLSDALSVQIHKLRTSGDSRDFKAFVSEIQRLEQARQVLDLKIAEANESLRQRYSAQLQRARQRISALRSDNLLCESQLKTMSRQVSSACSSPVGMTSTLTMGELGSPVNRDSTLRLTAPSGQLARSRELRASFRPAQSARTSLSPYGTARRPRPNDDNEDRRIEEIKKEVESLKSQLTTSARDRKKVLFSDSPQSDSLEYKKKLAFLTSEAKEFIKLAKDIIRSANHPEAAEALKSFTRVVNDILRDWSFSEWRRSFQKPQEWSSKYALDQANKMLESENKKLEEALALEKTRSDRLIEMVEAFKKDIQPKSAELVAKLNKEVRQLTERKQELEALAETLQGDRKREQKEHEIMVSELHSDYEALGEELKLIRKSKAELQRSSQIREAEIKAKVSDLEREKAKTRSEIAQYVQTAASRLASQYEFLEEKLSKVRTRLLKVEDLAKQLSSDNLQRLQTLSSPNTPQEVESRLSTERERMESVLRQNQEWTNSRILELAGRVETAEGQEIALLEDLRREREANAKLLLELEAGKCLQVRAAEALKLAGKYEEIRRNAENEQGEMHLLSIETAKLRREKGFLQDKNAELASNEAVLRAETMQLRELLKLSEKAEEIVEESSNKADHRYEVDLAAEIPSESPNFLEINELREKCELLELALKEKEQKLVAFTALQTTELQKERVKWGESLHLLESQRSDLLDEVSRLKASCPSKSTQEQSSAKAEETQTLKESLNAATCRQEALEREIAQLQDWNRKLLREKEASGSESIAGQLGKLSSELRDTKEENQRLRAVSSEQHLSSMEDYETRINNFRDQLKALTASCDLVEREKTEMQAEASHERDLLNSKIRILTVSIGELSQVKNQALELVSRKGTELATLEKRYEERNGHYERICTGVMALARETGAGSSTVEEALATLSVLIKPGKQGIEGKSSDLCSGNKDYCSIKQDYEELTGKHEALLKDWQEALSQWETTKATLQAEADHAKSAFARLEDDYFNLKMQHSGQLTQLQTDFSQQLAARPSLPPPKTSYVPALPGFHPSHQISIESEGSEEESFHDQVQDMTPGPGDVVKTVEYDGIAWNLICSGEKVYQWLQLDGVETPSERDMSVMERLKGLLEPVCGEGTSVEDAVAALVREIMEIRRKKSTGSPIFPRNRGSNLASQFAYLDKGFSSPDLSDRREDLNSFEIGEGQLGLPPPISFGLSSREPGSGRSEHHRDEQIGKYLQMVNDLRDEVKTLKLALTSEQSDNKRLEEMMHVLRDELRVTGTRGKTQGESLLPHVRTAIVGLAVELPKLTVKGEGLLSTIYSHLDLSAKQVALIEQGRKGKKADKAGVVAQVLG